MSEPELKPLDCPCCGTAAGIIYSYTNYERMGFLVVCQNQDCLIQTPKYESMKMAVEAWNARYQPFEPMYYPSEQMININAQLKHYTELLINYKKAIEFIEKISNTICVSTANHFYLIEDANKLLRELGELEEK